MLPLAFGGGPIRPQLYLARHGESLWNQDGRITGQADCDLSQKGERQADLLAESLAHVPLVAVISSPLIRARRTADAVAVRRSLSVQVEPDLREVGFGSIEGHYRDVRDPAALGAWERWRVSQGTEPPAGGESFDQLVLRVIPVLRRCLGLCADGPVLIVGHRNVNRVILAELLGWSRSEAFAARISHRTIHEICLGPPAAAVTRRLPRLTE